MISWTCLPDSAAWISPTSGRMLSASFFTGTTTAMTGSKEMGASGEFGMMGFFYNGFLSGGKRFAWEGPLQGGDDDEADDHQQDPGGDLARPDDGPAMRLMRID